MTLYQAVKSIREKGYDVVAGRLFGGSTGPWFVRAVRGGTVYEAVDEKIRVAAERLNRVV